MSKYARANSTVQWFQDTFPGEPIDPNTVVVHTTEGTSWPGYDDGASAPHYTARPDFARKRLRWRQHFPDEASARALRNEDGGVETNTLNCVQVELVGTCDPKHATKWQGTDRRAGVDYIYWPDAPDWALRELARFLADMHRRHGVKLEAPRFRAYPDSFGLDNGVRFTFRQWRGFFGVCGHQHVPENTHGDPGNLDMPKVLRMAQSIVAPKPEQPAPLDLGNLGPNVTHALAYVDKALAGNPGPVRKARLERARTELTHINIKP